MNLIIYKHYNKDVSKSLIQSDMDKHGDNSDYGVSFVSGNKDIIEVLKELIKTEYTVQ